MPTKVRQFDANNHDKANPKYRRRLVAKEFKRYSGPNLFSSTTTAHAHTSTHPARLQCSWLFCEEDRGREDEGMCGELSVSMYGARAAARRWQIWYTELLGSWGFLMIRGNTCTLWHLEQDVVVMVHGDDFVSTADMASLRWLEDMHKERFQITTNVMDTTKTASSRIMWITGSVSGSGYTHEPDVRHSEMIGQGAKTLSTIVPDVHHESEKLAGSRTIQEVPVLVCPKRTS